MVLHRFTGVDGAQPSGSLIFDDAGNLYGTTAGGGAFGWGTVFELKPQAGGKWTEKYYTTFTKQRVSRSRRSRIDGQARDMDGSTSRRLRLTQILLLF